MRKVLPAILAVAGSDPSGGAGIQADLKTLTSLGVYGAAAVTAITVQNSLGVQSCQPLEPALVQAQMTAVLDDLAVSHVKIGMIGCTAVAQAVARVLSGFAGEIVYDPVIFSSVGQPRLTTDDLQGVRLLAGLASVLTPNLPELRLLSGLPCLDRAEALRAGGQLLASSPRLRALVIKGGHLEEGAEVTDVLLLPGSAPYTVHHPRIATPNSHGTGCTFASALAAWHQRTGDYRQAFTAAVAYLDRLLRCGGQWQVGRGNGGLCHHLAVAAS